MLVSVIIPSYNYAHFIERAVKSVYEQSYSFIECIVVNDGSIDNTVEVLENLKTKYESLIIINKENAGLSAARNSGLKVANGDYIAFLDADDYWLKDKIKNQINVFNKNQTVKIVHTNFCVNNNNKIEKNSSLTLNNDQYELLSRNSIWGSASSVMIKKEVFHKVGYFDCSLRSSEDHDYWFRCVVEGYKFYFVNKFDVIITLHSSGRMSDNNLNMFIGDYLLLQKQLLLLNYEQNIEKNKFENALKIRISKLRWLSKSNDMRELRYMTYFLGIRLIGVKFIFNKLMLLNILKEIFKIK